MELIVGGKSQGKLDYAIETFHIERNGVSDGKLIPADVIYNFQKIIKEMCDASMQQPEIEKEIVHFVEQNPAIIIICDEIGCGLVPMEQQERNYRENTGRICCLLASMANRVHRVTCGIGVVIKND